MANDQGTETPISQTDLFKRQSEAGTVIGGIRQPELSVSERQELTSLTNKKTENQATGTVQSEIIELQKKAANAGNKGAPDLTPEERKTLVDYYASKK
ncbi:MAG TPA: hypothetical protein VKC54_02000 [Patescibacteria group bacterium]|nr:hypothetical protein [Patescibacteria group bacterium]